MSAKIVNIGTHRKSDAEEKTPAAEPAHLAILRGIWNSAYPLSQSEQMFVRTMSTWQGEPTPRQAAWMQNLFDRVEAFEKTMRGK